MAALHVLLPLGGLALALPLALRTGGPAAAPPPAPAVRQAPAAEPVPAEDGGLTLTRELQAAGVTELDVRGPHDPPADAFHPDPREVRPALGGLITQHIISWPPAINFAIENSAVVRWIWVDVHAALLQFDPATWTYEPDLSVSHDVEDTLVLKGGRGDDNGNIVFGAVEETAEGYVVTSGSAANPIERRVVAKDQVESLERGTVWTFRLRDGVLWHDGHPFDVDDVLFSMSIYSNPHVDCDEKRYKFEDVVACDSPGPGLVRFFWKEQYFGIEGAFGFDFPILARHRYDLLDPDNDAHDPDATLEQRGAFVNDHPDNTGLFVGLGPYRITRWEHNQFIEAERFDGYWEDDPAVCGYADTLRWRCIPDDTGAWNALLNGEVDTFDRVKSEDFFGEATQLPSFTERLYKAFTYIGNLNYTGWNMQRPLLSDVRVRRALSQAFDVPGWLKTNYKGYALWATSNQFFFGPAYDHGLEPYPYDPAGAEELLADAGFYDRDGNGIVDKDGQDLVVGVLMPTGNVASRKLLQAMQEAYTRVGVKLDVVELEWATMLERTLERDFDGVNMSWSLTAPESDPYQLWHGSQASGRTSNRSGYADPESDRLIEAGRRELDDEKRWEIWHQLHRRIYELQPYLFGWNVPRKLAFNKALRGVKLYKWDPGFRLRDMYYAEGTPGTRPLPPATER